MQFDLINQQISARCDITEIDDEIMICNDN